MIFSDTSEFDRLRVAFNSAHDFKLEDHLLVLARVGSVAYNTNVTEQSDLDLMGVVVPPARYLIGLSRWEHWTTKIGDDLDVKIFSLQKFIGLLLKSNPTVLELLWIELEHLLVNSLLWAELLANREKFSSQKAYYAFVGYASDQIKRMRQAARVTNELKEIEIELAYRERYGESHDFTLLSDEDLTAYHYELQTQVSTRRQGHARKELIEKLGYDPKNAGHAVRLMRMGLELLETGKMNVRRESDAEFLRNIRLGKYDLAFVEKEIEVMSRLAEHFLSKTELPREPDSEFAERYVIDVHRSILNQ